MLSLLSSTPKNEPHGGPQDLTARVVWPSSAWTVDRYKAALYAMSDLHATWWDSSEIQQNDAGPWVPIDTIYAENRHIAPARDALLFIRKAAWGSRLLSKEQIGSLLYLLENGGPVLDILQAAPRTLITGSNWPIGSDLYSIFDSTYLAQSVEIGPAAYDVAAFYSSSRWWFGRTPFPMAATRNTYLQRMQRLGRPIERCMFDATFDAALAWRFATVWPQAIMEQHQALLTRTHQMQSTVIEPAFAALRRCAAL